MIKNYLLIAWRTTIKNPLFSFINIVSLSLSISLCMIVVIHLHDEFSYDNFHGDSDRTYRIISNIRQKDGREWTLASSPLPLKETLDGDAMIFSNTVSLYPNYGNVLSDGVKDIPVRSAFTQPAFFDVFGFTLRYGDVSTALSRPRGIILSHTTAEKFFDHSNPVGQMMKIDHLGEFEVTGVLEAPPSKSHINFDAYISWETVRALEASATLPPKSQTWDSFENGYTYVKLSEGIAENQLVERLAVITSSINKQENSGTFILKEQALGSITPTVDDLYNDIGRGSTWGKLLAEIGIAFIILAAACFNYTNLSIARSLTRTKEVGIRKMSGAYRWQIFYQYIVESVLVALISLVFAQIILEFILAYNLFNEGYEFIPAVNFDIALVLSFVALAIFVGLLAGVLPATLLSSLSITRLMRKVSNEKIMGGLSLRKVLLVFQFSLSLVVIIFLSVFDRQFEYMAVADPGYRMDHIASIKVSASERSGFIQQLSMIPEVQMTGRSSEEFGGNSTGMVLVSQTHIDQYSMKMDFYFADAGKITLSNLKLVDGKNFAHEPSSKEDEIILNERAVVALGFKTTGEAIGQKLFIEDSTRVTVVGVVKDFYNTGVGSAPRPLLLRQKEGSLPVVSILFSDNANKKSARAAIESAWRTNYPGKPMNFEWILDAHDRSYSEMGSVSLLGFLAFMTVAIATLGLLGLVVYTVETRRKEISVRKIIGASVYQVTMLLSGGFVRLLFIAGLIALPIAWVLGELFLMNFVTKTSVSLTLLLGAFGFLLGIGLLLIGSQTAKAALDNPVKHLHND